MRDSRVARGRRRRLRAAILSTRESRVTNHILAIPLTLRIRHREIEGRTAAQRSDPRYLVAPSLCPRKSLRSIRGGRGAACCETVLLKNVSGKSMKPDHAVLLGSWPLLGRQKSAPA
jgi:hypothetical protein